MRNQIADTTQNNNSNGVASEATDRQADRQDERMNGRTATSILIPFVQVKCAIQSFNERTIGKEEEVESMVKRQRNSSSYSSVRKDEA